MTQNKLQYGFSEMHATAAFDAQARARKARKVIAILQDCLGTLDTLKLLDIGCSAGLMTEQYASYFSDITAIDVDLPAVQHAARRNRSDKIQWSIMDSQQMGLPDAHFDVVTCTHIYEHVPDAEKLMAEIRRVLKPNGVCFFGAGNRFSLMEPHYRLPLLSVIPKPLAHLYLRAAGRGKHYYETHLSYWGLRRLTAGFKLHDYTIRVAETPEKFHADDMLPPGSAKQKLALGILRHAYWACPTYLWVLKKI